MYTQHKGTVRFLLRGTVKIRTEGVRKLRLLQSAVYGVVNCLERSRSRAPGAQCATGPPKEVKFVYKQRKCTVRVLLRRAVQLRTAGVRKYRLL